MINYKDQNCVIDFTYIKDKNHLNQKLNSKLAIDIKFFPLKIIYLDLYEEDVKKFISNIFVANSYLNCREALNKIND